MAARDLVRTFYPQPHCRIQVSEGVVLFSCPDGVLVLYPTHVEGLKWKGPDDKLEAILDVLIRRLGHQRCQRAAVIKMHDVLSVLPGSAMDTAMARLLSEPSSKDTKGTLLPEVPPTNLLPDDVDDLSPGS
ncbi:MAG: hypothetical protein MUE83_15860 [Tabrizicola sp.]|nr:hypothetical protein [Tabrizicola sp.]